METSRWYSLYFYDIFMETQTNLNQLGTGLGHPIDWSLSELSENVSMQYPKKQNLLQWSDNENMNELKGAHSLSWSQDMDGIDFTSQMPQKEQLIRNVSIIRPYCVTTMTWGQPVVMWIWTPPLCPVIRRGDNEVIVLHVSSADLQ
jgi:hypothetical protein